MTSIWRLWLAIQMPYIKQRRKLYPMPITGLIDDPGFIAMPAAGRGMLITLMLYYWQTECAPLPKKYSEIFAIMRANPTTWAGYRDEIMRIFELVKPELDEYFQTRVTKRSVMKFVGAKGLATARANRLEKKAPVNHDPEHAAPVREFDRRVKVPTPEERGARPRIAPSKKG